jgi:hypothetical protein
MNRKTKQIMLLAVWGVIVFGLVGCIGQQTGTPDTTITLPPVVVTDVVTIPAETVEIVIPAETVTVTSPGGLDTPPVTITADPITVTTQVPAKTVIQTVTAPPQTIVIPVTTTEARTFTITTDRVVITKITVKGDTVEITKTIPVTITTTQLNCPPGYEVSFGGLGNTCVRSDAPQIQSIGGYSIGSIPIEYLVIAAIAIILLLRQRSKKKKK